MGRVIEYISKVGISIVIIVWFILLIQSVNLFGKVFKMLPTRSGACADYAIPEIDDICLFCQKENNFIPIIQGDKTACELNVKFNSKLEHVEFDLNLKSSDGSWKTSRDDIMFLDINKDQQSKQFDVILPKSGDYEFFLKEARFYEYNQTYPTHTNITRLISSFHVPTEDEADTKMFARNAFFLALVALILSLPQSIHALYGIIMTVFRESKRGEPEAFECVSQVSMFHRPCRSRLLAK